MVLTNKYVVKGMKCGSCAYVINMELMKIKGVKNADVDFGERSVKIEADNDIDEVILNSVLKVHGYVLTKRN